MGALKIIPILESTGCLKARGKSTSRRGHLPGWRKATANTTQWGGELALLQSEMNKAGTSKENHTGQVHSPRTGPRESVRDARSTSASCRAHRGNHRQQYRAISPFEIPSPRRRPRRECRGATSGPEGNPSYPIYSCRWTRRWVEEETATRASWEWQPESALWEK